MSNFEMKLTPKDKADQSKFINFKLYKGLSFKPYNGKVVYANVGYPDKHIYQPYYCDVDALISLRYYKNEKWNAPLLTLDELNYEDHIIFFDSEDVKTKK